MQRPVSHSLPFIFWFSDILEDNKPTLLCDTVIAGLLKTQCLSYFCQNRSHVAGATLLLPPQSAIVTLVSLKIYLNFFYVHFSFCFSDAGFTWKKRCLIIKQGNSGKVRSQQKHCRRLKPSHEVEVNLERVTQLTAFCGELAMHQPKEPRNPISG